MAYPSLPEMMALFRGVVRSVAFGSAVDVGSSLPKSPAESKSSFGRQSHQEAPFPCPHSPAQSWKVCSRAGQEQAGEWGQGNQCLGTTLRCNVTLGGLRGEGGFDVFSLLSVGARACGLAPSKST